MPSPHPDIAPTGARRVADRAGTEIVVATLMRRAGRSGVQTHVANVVSLLRDAAFPVHVVSPFSAGTLALRPVLGIRPAVERVSGSGGVWWYRHWHGRSLARALRQHLRCSDVATTVYAQCPVSAEAALQARRPGQRVVMAVHFNSSQADEWADKGTISRGGSRYEAIRRFEALTLPRLDGIVYVSRYMRSVLEERIPLVRKVPSVVVPNFLEVSTSPPPDAAAPPEFIGDVISVGSLEPRKNHRYLLEVLRAASDRGHRYHLTLVGDGPERRPLERLSARLGLAEQVTFSGYRPNARSLMPGHRAYCHSARLENLPFVVMEAMAEGLPVLAAPVGGIPEMIEPGVDGEFWPFEDPGAAADVLIRLMENEPARRAMARSARAKAAARYSRESVATDLLRFLTGGGA